mmetsp:Transcript_114229/g.209901  ORF Transcript_114229/g.209901 Transcript_114229/m.209901 type:complete len:86 (+) Transcript_114229:340-597(+)
MSPLLIVTRLCPTIPQALPSLCATQPRRHARDRLQPLAASSRRASLGRWRTARRAAAVRAALKLESGLVAACSESTVVWRRDVVQ